MQIDNNKEEGGGPKNMVGHAYNRSAGCELCRLGSEEQWCWESCKQGAEQSAWSEQAQYVV